MGRTVYAYQRHLPTGRDKKQLNKIKKKSTSLDGLMELRLWTRTPASVRADGVAGIDR